MKQSIHSTALSGPQTPPVCFVFESGSWMRKDGEKTDVSKQVNIETISTSYKSKEIKRATVNSTLLMLSFFMHMLWFCALLKPLCVDIYIL